MTLATTGFYLFGTGNLKFYSFRQSFATVILIALGFQDDLLLKFDTERSIFIIICIIVLYFVLVNMFAAIYVETFRGVSLEFGPDFHRKYIWKVTGKNFDEIPI